MIPDFAGKVIEIVRLDWRLMMWTSDNWEIDISTPVTVDSEEAAPVEVRVDVEGPDIPDSLRGVQGQTIRSLLVRRDGSLVIGLEDRSLRVAASEDFEAWQIAGFDGERLISLPGGDLAHFPPTPGATASDE